MSTGGQGSAEVVSLTSTAVVHWSLVSLLDVAVLEAVGAIAIAVAVGVAGTIGSVLVDGCGRCRCGHLVTVSDDL